MKTNILKICGLMLVPAFFACNNATKDSANADSLSADSASAMTTTESSYVDLSTGQPVIVVRDTEKGYYVYSDTRQPIEDKMFFVDVNTRDTLYGKSGVVVNNAVIKTDAGVWSLDESMIEHDGEEIKIKSADGSKLKVDGEEMKYKEGDTKIKVDGNETKTKTGNTKTKVDGNETKIKVDN
jgi:predicted regulator of Ras-like GTPase activity (Roadblock/LC7/MglB family)